MPMSKIKEFEMNIYMKTNNRETRYQTEYQISSLIRYHTKMIPRITFRRELPATREWQVVFTFPSTPEELVAITEELNKSKTIFGNTISKFTTYQLPEPDEENVNKDEAKDDTECIFDIIYGKE